MTSRCAAWRSALAGAVIAAGAWLAGCATGSTTEQHPPVRRESFSAITFVDADPSGGASPEVKKKFENTLSYLLFRNSTFVREPGGLTIRYRFTRFDPGSQFTRWARHHVGSGGEGKLTVEVDYLDPGAAQLASILVEAQIAGGLTGGHADEAIGKAADEVAAYTRKYFR
jgi:hypothetical protein